jgi:molybdenum cofactor cytidylyltransferase
MIESSEPSVQATNRDNLGVVLIAAGNSSRLGQAKQLVRYRNELLLNKAHRLAISVSQSVVCVLGFKHQELIRQITVKPESILINSNWQIGMGSSIAAGVMHFSSSKAYQNIDALLILLCDQYLLTELDLKNLCSQWTMNPTQIIASQYFDDKKQQEVLGAPAIFPKNYFSQLQSLTHKGARKLLQQHRQDVIAVELKNAGTDLDTKNDLQQLQARED